MGRSWNRYDASLEDIKRCRKAILSQFPNATDIYFDEYLVDRHQNESCNANKFYYGAVLETKDGRFQAATSYGRIGDYNKAFGGIKAFDEGSFTNFDSAKRKLNEKLDKKKRGKRCSKCKTRQRYSPFAPKNAEEYGAETFNATAYSMIEHKDDWCLRDIADSLRPKYDLEGNKGFFEWDWDSSNGNVTLAIYDDANTKLDKIIYDRKALAKALKSVGYKNPESWGAESMSPQVFGKLVGQYPQPPNNPLPVGGFMDEGFEWTVNQAESASHICPFCGKDFGVGNFRSRNAHMGYAHRDEYQSETGLEDYYCTKCDEGFSSITPTDEGQFCNNCLPDSATPHNEMDATTQKEEFGAKTFNVEDPNCKCWRPRWTEGTCETCSEEEMNAESESIVSKVKNNWLNGLIGVGLGLVGFDFLKKKGYVANADTLIESPNTGDLTPADYEEIVVESTGYAVPIIPVSLDGSFMGSRFHALPTDRYVYDSPEGIGAHSDVAMKRNTTFLPNEMSLVQASEAPGQSPYNSLQPNGQENTDFPLRVIHETTTVSLDPSTAPFIPTDMSGYTGQQFIPTSVYEDMLGVGISGRVPSFSQPASGDIGSNHFGSRIANPDMLTNVGGPLTDSVNGDYTDGSTTMSLSQWSIENQVQQISDTEAIVVERGSGGRKMIRRV